MTPLINIIIRTSNRPAQFARCLQSVTAQTYKNVRVIIGFDEDAAEGYIPDGIETHFVTADTALPYFYDLYCNTLKAMVTEGWFFFLDDDDRLANPTVLEQLAAHLNEPGAIICQMLRNGVPKPADNYIRRGVIREGKIGLPCLVLHSRYRNLSRLDGQKAGDYRYIKSITEQVPTRFIPLQLVNAGVRGRGIMESNNNLSNISE